MEKRHQKIITKNLTLLQQGIIPMPEFYAGLLEKEVFTQEMVEQIQAFPTRGQQVFQMLNLLKSRGPKALRNFIQVLETTGHEDLANKLREAMAQAENGVEKHSHRKVDEFITKHLQRLHKLLSQEERKVLTNNLVLKEDFQEEKNLKESQEQCDWLNVVIQTLQQDVEELNMKLNTSLDVNKKNQVKISQLQQQITAQQVAIAEKDDKIGELTEKLAAASTVKRPDIDEVTDLHNTKKEQETQIKLLEEKLEKKEDKFEKMQENLKSQIHTRDSKIVKINEQLENICENVVDDLDLLKMNKNISEGDKNILLLQMNIGFLSKRIETLDTQLTSAHQTVDSLKEEKEMCQQILGFPLDKQCSLKHSIRRMIEKNSAEKQSLQKRISSLEGKLTTLEETKKSIQLDLKHAQDDKEMMKSSISALRMQLKEQELKHGRKVRSANSQGDNSYGRRLPELPVSSSRSLHKSTNSSHLLSYTNPTTVHVNVSYPGSTSHRRLRTRYRSLSGIPTTLEQSVCVVCRQKYKEAENHDTACRFHPKSYKEFNFEESKRWQCCFRSAETDPGCTYQKHTSEPHYW